MMWMHQSRVFYHNHLIEGDFLEHMSEQINVDTRKIMIIRSFNSCSVYHVNKIAVTTITSFCLFFKTTLTRVAPYLCDTLTSSQVEFLKAGQVLTDGQHSIVCET